MEKLSCCILGCKEKDILSVCKKCRMYFCFHHRNLIDSHELINGFSVLNQYYCCNYCCSMHFYLRCDICEEMIINTMTIIKDGLRVCKYPCFKYQK